MSRLLVFLAATIPLVLFSQNWNSTCDDFINEFNSGEYDKSIETGNRCLLILADEDGKDTSYCNVLYYLEYAHYYTESYEEAVKLAKEEVAIRKEIQGDTNLNYITACYNYSVFSTYTKDYRTAIHYMQLVLNYYKKEYGEESEYTLQIANQYANILQLAGSIDLARRVYEKSYAIVKSKYTIADSTFQAMTNTVSAFYYTNKLYDLCEPFFTDALAYQEKAVGKNSETYILTLKNTGEFYANAGMLEKADKIFDEQLEVSAEFYGTKSEAYLLTVNAIGELCLNAGMLKKAEQVFTEQLEVSAKFYGKNSADYATSLNNLAVALENQDKLEEADELYQQALKLKAKVFKKESSFYALTLLNYGILKYRMGQYEESEKMLTETMEIYEKVLSENSSEYIRATSQIALVWQNYGELEKASQILKKSMEVSKKNFGEENIEYAALMEILGNVLVDQGKFKEGEEWIQKALSIRENIQGKEHPDYLTTLTKLARIMSYSGNYKVAENLLKNVLDIRLNKLDNENLDVASTYSELANVMYGLGNVSEARKYHEFTLLEAKKVVGDMHPDYMVFLSNAGVFYLEIGEINQALNLFDEALQKGKLAYGDHAYELHYVYSNIGNVYLKSGDFKSAESAFSKSLKILENSVGKEHPDYASTLNSMGVLYYQLGNYKKAEKYYAESLPIYKKVYGKEHPEYATICNNIGSLYMQMGGNTTNPADQKLYWDQAEVFMKKVLSIDSTTIGLEHPDFAIHLNNLAELARNRNDADKAEEYYLKTIALEEKLYGSDNINAVSTLNNLALLYLGKMDLEKAEEYARKAIEVDSKLFGEDRIIIPKAWSTIAYIEQQKGNYDEAQQWHEKILKKEFEIVEKNFSFLSEEEKGQFIEDFTWLRNNYFQFLRESKRSNSNSAELAYAVSVFEKGLLLRSTQEMKRQVANSGNKDLIAKYEHWLGLKQELAKAYVEPNQDKSMIAQLEERCDGLEKELVSATNVKLDRQNFEAKKVQDQLKENQVAIEFIEYQPSFYAGSQEKFYSAVVVPNEGPLHYIELFEASELEKEIGKVGMNNVTYIKSVYGDGEVVNRALYEIIWKPMDSILEKGQELFYSPSGMLNKISFAAVFSLEHNDYLSGVFTLNQLNSTDFIPSSTEKELRKNWEVTLFGGAKYSSKETENEVWKYLAGTLRETHNIGHLLDEANFKVREQLEFNATEENLKACDGNQAPRILHIATHGFFYPDPMELALVTETETDDVNFRGGSRGHEAFVKNINPLMRSGLVLSGANNVWNEKKDTLEFEDQMNAEDGVITAFEISALDLSKTELAVLSACETGLGDIKGSEGVYGLQRAFKMAGVKSLIMSLWQVPDKETEEFMTLFYKNLIKEKNIRSSFLKAQSIMRGKYPPYYWAAFVLVE